MAKFKALLLDLDDTLIKSNLIYDRALRFSSDYLAEKYKLDKEEFFKLVLDKHLIVHRNFPTIHTRHSRILVFRMALEETVKNYDLGLLPSVEDMYWDFFMNNIELYEGICETLELIRKSKVKIAIVSDGDLSLRIRKVESAGLMKYIDQLVASEEVIFEKPFSAIFTLALTRLKVEAGSVVMLGNDYKSDVRGAQLLGIKAGVFSPLKDGNVINKDDSIKADFIIKKFGEIIDVLEIRK
ncbi:HAD-IA family hydrolase [Candidatus Dojkabacteria bacterium]|nr:HAD-IA family hydrolase [Candidatus Dojkabacteria bacterium]